MGEFELLARLRERLPPGGPRVLVGIGDDAAVTVPGGATATSVDALVDGVHFRREQTSLRAIGQKALATALSDLAAMGAEAGEAYVALGVPRDLDEDGCLELLDGIEALAAETGVSLLGGDITRAPALVVVVTVVGHAERAEMFVTRAGARPGDAVVLTGELGGAGAGLLLLEHPEIAAAVPEALAAGLRERLLAPRPRLAAGLALRREGAGAMIDISDGLGADAEHLAQAGGIGISIDLASVPVPAGVAEVASAAGRDPLSIVAKGGEDYELLAALPPERVEEAVRAVSATGTSLTPVGQVVSKEGVALSASGRTYDPGGFDQLS